MQAGLPCFPRAERVTAQLLRTLAAHRAPAVGFVNEHQLDAAGERERRVALLRQWIAGGHDLGNHIYSHVDLNTHTVEPFQRRLSR